MNEQMDNPGTGETLEEQIIDALRSVYDPEIPVNLYDLGLIYELNLESGGQVGVVMTLTAPNCPVADQMPVQVKQAVERVPGVNEATVELTWDPPWDPSKMSEAAKLELGFL